MVRIEVGMRRLKRELWPHMVEQKCSDDNSENSIHEWLESNVGLFKDRWNAVYGFYNGKNDYYFVDECDMIVFILRWQ